MFIENQKLADTKYVIVTTQSRGYYGSKQPESKGVAEDKGCLQHNYYRGNG